MIQTDLLEEGNEKGKDEVKDSEDNKIEIVDNDDDEYAGEPIISNIDLEGVDLHFLCGSEEDLKSEITTIFQAAMPLDCWDTLGKESLTIHVYASILDEEAARIDFENMEWNCNNWSRVEEQLKDLGKFKYIEEACNIAISNNEPSGYSWEYNDGAYDRISGYDKRSEVVVVEISRPSAHEQICARVEINKWKGSFTKKLIKSLIA